MLLTLLNLFARPIVFFLFKTRNVRIFLRARLSKQARVLELGPGHNPWFRSNVLCERYLTDNTERSGKLARDGRPLIQGDACRLPFADKSFDFVFCSHVMEHMEDVTAFIAEIQRVGKAGYLETPNYIFEQTVGTTTHKWAFWTEGETLHAEPKWVSGAPKRAYDGAHTALGRNPMLYLCHLLAPELRVMSLFWRDSISLVVHPMPRPLDETRASLT